MDHAITAGDEAKGEVAEGLLDGRLASFRYTRFSRRRSVLGFVEGHDATSTSRWTEIQAQSIICVVADSRGTKQDRYRLIYAVPLDSGDRDTEKTALAAKTAILENPPASLLEDFSLPASRPHSLSQLEYDKASTPNFHIIVSTGSGTGLAHVIFENLLLPVLEALHFRQDVDYVVHTTVSETSVAELTESIFLPRASEGTLQSILLLSGDGGLLDIVNTLLSGPRSANYTNPSVAVLPLGTGNALANSSGIQGDETLGMQTWLYGTPVDLPLFQTRFSSGARALRNEAQEEHALHMEQGIPTTYGAVVCSWGLHAGLVADSDTSEYRRFGAERFKMAAKEALFPSDGCPPHVYKGNVTIMKPGTQRWASVRQGEHAYVLATLVKDLEKGFTISPASLPVDGKLWLVHFGPMTGNEVMAIMGGAYQGGQHVQNREVGYEEVEKLRIEFAEHDARWRRVCVDGKIIRVEEGGWVEVARAMESVVMLTVPRR